MNLPRHIAHLPKYLRRVSIMFLSPLAEKNPTKALAVDAPLVLSFRRVALAALIVAAIRQHWKVGYAGWPEVTYATVLVVVVLFLGAFEKASTDQAVGVLNHLVDRFGLGQGRGAGESAKEFHEALNPEVVKRREIGGDHEPTP